MRLLTRLRLPPRFEVVSHPSNSKRLLVVKRGGTIAKVVGVHHSTFNADVAVSSGEIPSVPKNTRHLVAYRREGGDYEVNGGVEALLRMNNELHARFSFEGNFGLENPFAGIRWSQMKKRQIFFGFFYRPMNPKTASKLRKLLNRRTS